MWAWVLGTVLVGVAPFMAAAVTGNVQAPTAPGDAKALLTQGDAYLYGEGVPRDGRKALECYRQAAETDADGLTCLGHLYFHGDEGVRPNYTEALKWYEKAAAAGKVEAVHRLGKMYSRGLGTVANQEKAFQWFLQAADMGDDYARMEIAFRCFVGNGTPIDRERCLKYARELNASTHDEKLKLLSSLLMAECLALQGDSVGAFKALGKTGSVLVLGAFYVVAAAGMSVFAAIYLFVAWRKRRKYAAGEAVSPGVVDALAGFFVFAVMSSLFGVLVVLDARLMLLLAVLGGLASILFWGVVFRARGQRTRQVVPMTPLALNKSWKYLLSALCVIFVFDMLYQLVLGAFGVSLDNQLLATFLPKPGASAAAFVGALLCGGVLAPFCEEFIFRGIVYRGLATRIPDWGAAMGSSLLFSVLHMELKFMLPIFVMGLLMCWAYRKSGSLLAPVAIHALNNLIALSLIMAGVET